MAEISFSFENQAGISASLAYARDPDGSGRLSVRFSSDRIRRAGGEPKGFGLEFNAIGKGHPFSFLVSLDQGYLNEKIGALSVSRYDLFATIENVRRVAQSPEYELTADQIEEVERLIDAAACDFTGDHSISSQMLIGALSRMDLSGFQDDPYHLVGKRRTHENRVFETEVWPAVLDQIDEFLAQNPDVEAAVEAVVAGRALPAPKAEAEEETDDCPTP